MIAVFADPAAHAIETFVISAVTFGLIVYFVVALLVMWAERPMVGRYDDKRPRPVRGKYHKKGT